MNLQYVLWYLCSLAVALAMYALMTRSQRDLPARCLLIGILGTLCAAVGAKLLYYLAKIDFMVMNGWLNSLVDMTMGTFSYYGGVAGFCLGVVLSARILRIRPMALLDDFTPAGLLLAALARFGEVTLDGVGIRDMLYWEHPERCFFPLAVTNEWGDWLYAVFMLEGLLTLGVLVFSLVSLKEWRFARSLYYMCLIQILCESLRSDSFTWLFVRVEQVLCLLVDVGVLAVYCFKTRGVRGRWLPVLYCVPIAAVFVVLEFALNGKIPFSHDLCYVIMIAGLIGLGVIEHWAFRRMKACSRRAAENVR